MKLLDILKDSRETAASVVEAELEPSSEQSLRNSLQENRNEISQIMSYLKKNNEMIDTKIHADSLDALLELNKQELSHAFDLLILCLGDREKAIEGRLKQAVEHFGDEERILIEKKDFKREVEDIERIKTNPDAAPIETVISVN